MKNQTDILDKRKLSKDYTELHFFDEVYRVYLVLMISSREDFKKFVEKQGFRDMDSLNFEGSSGYTIKFDEDTADTESYFTYIWMERKHIPCLVHELTHLTMITFDDKDVPIRIENQETFAYYIEHWVKRITEVWTPPRVKRDKVNKVIKETE